MRSISLRGKIESEDNSYFFSSELGSDYVIAANSTLKETLSRLKSSSVSIKGTIHGSTLRLYSIMELKNSLN